MESNPNSSSMIAICCGPTVTTWIYSASKSETDTAGAANDGIVDTFTPHGSSILADMAWHHNGRVLATCSTSCSAEEENINLTNLSPRTRIDGFSNSVKKATKSNEWRPPATSISFGGKSRYLCISDAGGYVSIWDTKKKSRVRHLHAFSGGGASGRDGVLKNTGADGSLCNRACIDPSDTYIAALSSSSDDGSLRLFNLRDAKLVHTHRPPDGSHGGADALRFSSFQNNHAAVGTRDGSVFVWDATSTSSHPTSSMVEVHENTVTDVCFSPANGVLLATSSLDGTFAFHDIKSGKTIQVVSPPQAASVGGSNSGVTCLSLHNDGVTCAVGTAQEMVCLYDLRKTSSGPISTLRVGNSSYGGSDSVSSDPNPVVSLRFAPEVLAEKRTKALYRSAKKIRQDEKENHLDNTTRSQSPIARSSPLSHNTEKLAAKISLSNHGSHRSKPVSTPNIDKEIKPLSEMTDRNDPPNQTPMASTADEANIPKTPYFSQKIQSSLSVTNSLSDGVGESAFDDNQNDVLYTTKSAAVAAETPNYRILREQSDESPPPSKVDKSVSAHTQHQNEFPRKKSYSSTESVVKTPLAPSSTDQYENYASETPLHTNLAGLPSSPVSINPATVTTVVPPAHNDENDVNMKVNKLVLKNMVENAVDNLRDDMEISMRNLHVDILRQFQRQSDEISQMFQQQRETIENLLEENRELREENERLRRFY